MGGNDDDADQTDDEDDGPRATEIVDAPASTRTRAPQTTSSDAAAGGLVAPVGGLLGGLLAVLAWL